MTATSTLPPKEPNATDAGVGDFLAALFRRLGAGEAVAFRPLRAGRAFREERFTRDRIRDAEQYVRQVAADPAVTSVYVHMNPVRADGRGSVDAGHVTRRLWIVADADPYKVGPDGQELSKVNATDGEKAEAERLTGHVHELLRGRGFGDPAVVTDSGNGFHSWYAVELPNDPESKDLVEAFLKTLGRAAGGRFGARIDTALHDAPRLARVPGAWNRKHEGTDERPQRLGRLLSVAAGPPVPAGVIDRFIGDHAGHGAESEKAAESAEERVGADGWDPPTADEVSSALNHVGGADDYGTWIEVGQCLHSWDTSEAALGLWCDWSRGSNKYDGAVCGEKWKSFKAGGKRTIRTVFWYARMKGWHYGPRIKQSGTGGGGKDCPGADAGGPEFTLGPCTIRPGEPRQTPSGKVVVPVAVWRDGKAVDSVQLSNAASGRREAAGLLAKRSGVEDRGQVADVLASVLAWAVDRLAAPVVVTGDTVHSIVAARVPELLRFTYRTDRGLWSEAEGRLIGRAELLAFVPTELLTAAAAGRDAPEDRAGLLRAVKEALEVLWADLRRTLKPAAALKEKTAAAREYQDAVIRLWKTTRTWEVDRDNNVSRAAKVSLAGMVQRAAHEFLNGRLTPGPRENWRPVREDVDAWWRPAVVTSGECVVLLAMRYTLAEQVGVKVPEATDQTSFKQLGISYGVFTDAPPVSDRLSDGGRLAVADTTVSATILARVVDEPSDPGSTDTGGAH